MSTTPRVIAPPSYHTPHATAKPRAAVLAVLHADGWVEIFGERITDVRIVTMPHMATPEGRQLAEEYLGLTLPKRFRKIYFPGNLRAADLVHVITPQNIAQQKWEMAMLKTVDGIAAGNKREVTTTWII